MHRKEYNAELLLQTIGDLVHDLKLANMKIFSQAQELEKLKSKGVELKNENKEPEDNSTATDLRD